MLGARFTHVGIGIRIRPGEAGDLLVAMVFARRPPPPSAPVTLALATAFLSSLRRDRRIGAVTVDPVLQTAAEAGLAALPAADPVSPDRAIDAASGALARESKRLRLPRRAVCVQLVQVLELDELAHDPLVMEQRLVKIGLATATRRIGNAVKILLLVLAEGAPCR
jgi:hypothetical protein